MNLTVGSGIEVSQQRGLNGPVIVRGVESLQVTFVIKFSDSISLKL